MKKNTLILIVVFLSTILNVEAQYRGDSWNKVKGLGKGKVVMVHLEAPALSHTTPNGYIEGICIDIVQEFVNFLKKEKNVTLQVELRKIPNDFSVFMNTVKYSKTGVWGVGNITITDARKKIYKFSPPFISNFSVLISNYAVSNLPNLWSMQNYFKNLKAYTVKGTTNEKILLDWKKKYFPELPIIYVNSSGEALKRVSQDPKSFTTLDFNFYAAAYKAGFKIKRHATGDSSLEHFGIIMPNDSDWNQVWSEFLNRFLHSPKYQKILAKHLGSEASELLIKAQK